MQVNTENMGGRGCKIANFIDDQFKDSCLWVKMEPVLPGLHFKPLFTQAAQASIKHGVRLSEITLTNLLSPHLHPHY